MDCIVGFVQLGVLSLYLITIFGRALYLGKRYRIQALIRDKEANRSKRFIDILFFVGTVFWVIKIVLTSLGSRYAFVFDIPLFDNIAIKLVGAVIVVAMYLLYLLALHSMKASWRIGIDRESGGDLVTGGVYRYSRNPIYVMMVMITFGVFLMSGSLLFLLAMFATTVYVHIQIRSEERFLSNKYGEEYEVYKKKVGRYFSVHPS